MMTTPAEHVRTWEALYDELYTLSLTADPDTRFAGWTSSYTGEPIPLAEMREWRDATVRRIGALNPRRVLEIGVGSGLLLTELAGRCDTYWGVDASGAAIDWLEDTLDDDLTGRVVLRQAAAHELGDLPELFFDTVILNSVVQYFPGTGYLREVLDGVFRLLAPGGAVFVGDVRNPRTQRCLLAAVAVAKGGGRAALERLLRLEKELLVDPGFFTGLPYGADVRLKNAEYHNELSRHRYDVILTEAPRPEHPVARRLAWGADVTSTTELTGHLAEAGGRGLAVTGIPNLRLTGELAVLAELESRPPPPPGTDPARTCALGARLGYRAVPTWSETDGCFDVLFTQESGVP